MYKYKTIMHLSLSGVSTDPSVPLEIEYTVTKGYAATREEPGQGDTVGIFKITLTDSKGVRYKAHDWLWELFEGNEELGEELLAEARAADDEAREFRDAMRGEHIA